MGKLEFRSRRQNFTASSLSVLLPAESNVRWEMTRYLDPRSKRVITQSDTSGETNQHLPLSPFTSGWSLLRFVFVPPPPPHYHVKLGGRLARRGCWNTFVICNWRRAPLAKFNFRRV